MNYKLPCFNSKTNQQEEAYRRKVSNSKIQQVQPEHVPTARSRRHQEIPMSPTKQNYTKEIQQYAKILGLDRQTQYNQNMIKLAFREKMIVASSCRKERIYLNIAYLRGLQKIYKNKSPPLLVKIAQGQTQEVNKILNLQKGILDRKIFDYVPLYYAVRSGHQDIVDMIIQMGCSLDFKDHKSTPLHCAAYFGHIKIIQLLAKHGVSANIRNASNKFPVEDCPNDQIKQYFISITGAQKNENNNNNQKFEKNLIEKSLLKQNNFQKIKKKFRTKMIEATENFDQRVKLNLEYLNDCEVQNKIKYPVIIRAIVCGAKKQVQWLLSEDKFLINTLIQGYVPLYYAARSGHQDIVELILKMGCSQNFLNQNSTPMHCAAYYGHKRIIILLKQYGFSVNIKNKYGNLPIEEAANKQIQQLLGDNQNISKIKQNKEMTQSKIVQTVQKSRQIQAEKKFRSKMVKAQDKEEKINFNIKYLKTCQQIYKVSYQPILWAIATGQADEVESMLRQNISLLNNLMFGYSLLYYAVRSGHEEVVECLLKLGCSLNLEGQLSTSVHCAAYYGHRNILLRLIREGSPTNIRNSKGRLAIEEAANQDIKSILSSRQKYYEK